MFSHGTGLSPVAVIASATFWTWLWGPIGLILATPLTICLVVLGRYVDRYALRRLRRKAPDAFVLVTMLGASNTTDARETLKDFPMTGLVESLDETVKQVRAASGPQDGSAPLGSNVLARTASL